MGTISIINPSPGTDFSEPVEVFIDVEKNKNIYSPTEMINETGSGSATYYAEVLVDGPIYGVVDEPTVYGFSLFVESDLVNAEFSFWSTDDLAAVLSDDNDWTNVTKTTAPNLGVVSDIDAVYPVITGLESKKLRVKCIITGGTDHIVKASSLSLV